MVFLLRRPNKPIPNRRPRFPLGGVGEFEYHVCAPPAFSAAVEGKALAVIAPPL
jgi:hypothetical protein